MDPEKKPRRKRIHRAEDFESPPEEWTEELDPDGEWHGSRRSVESAGAAEDSTRSSVTSLLLAFLALAVLPLCLTLLPRLLQERALSVPRAPSDARVVEAAHLSDLSQAIAARGDRHQILTAWNRGELATWDETVEIGAPLLASTDAGALFPPHLLWRIFGPEKSEPWLAGLSLLLLGFGMARFLLRRGLEDVAALLGGIGLQASGFFAANLHAPWRVWSLLFLPWMLLGIEKIHARERSGVLMTVLATGLSFYAGAPRQAFLALGVGLTWALVRGLRGFLAQDQEEGAARTLSFALLALFCGLGVAGPQLWPEWEAYSRSLGLPAGGGTMSEWATRTTADFLAFLLPRGGLAGAFDGRLYLGAPLLALALAGILGRTRRALFPLLAALLATGLMSAIEPLGSFLRALPAGEEYAPRDFAGLLAFSMCWLAALGTHACLLRLRRPWFVLFTSLGVVTFGCLIVSTRVEGEADSAARALASWTGAAVCLFTFARVMVTRESAAARRFPWVLILALVAGGGVELVRARSPHRLGAETWKAKLAEALGSEPGRGATLLEIARTEALARGLSLPPQAESAREWGWRNLSARRPYPNAELHRVLAELGPGALLAETWTGRRPRVVLRDEAFLQRGLFDLLQVQRAISAERLGEVSGMERTAESEGAVISSREQQEPFARLAPTRVIRTPDVSTLRKMVSLSIASGSPSTPLHATPGFEVMVPTEAARLALSFTPAEAELGGITEGSKLEARLEGSSGGRLVFREAFAPGWKATIDGDDARVLPADALFRQVYGIPPGTESEALVIRTKYEPWSLRYGAMLALLSLAGGALLLWRA